MCCLTLSLTTEETEGWREETHPPRFTGQAEVGRGLEARASSLLVLRLLCLGPMASALPVSGACGCGLVWLEVACHLGTLPGFWDADMIVED